jgi:AcrR family transcriptional regulator
MFTPVGSISNETNDVRVSTRHNGSMATTRRPAHSLGPPLDRATIADAALTLLDAEGLAAVTMRRIASQLDVRASSLYNHVRSKEEVLDAAADRVISRVDASGFDRLGWRDALERWAWSYYEALAAHPHLVPHVAARFGHIDSSLERADQVYAGLLRAGWSPGRATRIAAAVRYAVLGAAVGSFAAGFEPDPAAQGDRYPHLRETAQLRARGDAVDRGALALLLDHFLSGLAATAPDLVPVQNS